MDVPDIYDFDREFVTVVSGYDVNEEERLSITAKNLTKIFRALEDAAEEINYLKSVVGNLGGDSYE